MSDLKRLKAWAEWLEIIKKKDARLPLTNHERRVLRRFRIRPLADTRKQRALRKIRSRNRVRDISRLIRRLEGGS